MKLPIGSGADVNASDDERRTVLHWVIRISELDVMKMLISSGADVNARDDDGLTVLHLLEYSHSVTQKIDL